MDGHLSEEGLRTEAGPKRSGPARRLARWSARPAGFLTLHLAGMAAALGLGIAIARHERPVEAAPARVDLAGARQSAELTRSLEAQAARIEELTRQNEQTAKELSERDLDAEIARAEADALRDQNARLKKATDVFRSARVIFPRSPAPLPIRVPKATVVAIHQGAKEGVMPDGKGGFVVVRRPSASVAEALRNGLKKPAVVAQLTPADLGRDGKPIELQSPIGTVLRPGPVTLRWAKVDGATSYTVILQDEKGADVLGKEGEKVTAAESPFGVAWAVAKPLGPGVYRWQVIAHLGEGAEGKTLSAGGKQAAFAVLDGRKAAEITAAEAQFAGNALELGVRYAKLGMLDDAEAALIPFVAAYPESPQLKRLLEQVRGWRRFRSGLQ